MAPGIDAPAGADVAVLGGGCFWCLEACYQQLKGVSKVESGYAGGHVDNPTYEQVGKCRCLKSLLKLLLSADGSSAHACVFWYFMKKCAYIVYVGSQCAYIVHVE